MYRRRILKSGTLTQQDFIYQAARFFLHDDRLDIHTQLEILVKSNGAYDIANIEYAQLYSKMHKMDLLTEIGHLAELIKTAYTEGQKSRKYGRERFSKGINPEVAED
jgi:hypothetical protein